MFQYAPTGSQEPLFDDFGTANGRRYADEITSAPGKGYVVSHSSTELASTSLLNRDPGLGHPGLPSHSRSTSSSPGSHGAPSPEPDPDTDDMVGEEEEDGQGSGYGPAAGDRSKMKRFRLTHEQTRFLMSEFARQAHPDAAHRERLSRSIPGLSPRQVQVWFQNRRAKLKRLTSEDRERILRSRARPDNFEPAQMLRSGLPEGPRSGLSMVTSAGYATATYVDPHGMELQAALGGSDGPRPLRGMSSSAMSTPALPTRQDSFHRYQEPPRSARLPSTRTALTPDQIALQQYQRALEAGPEGLSQPLGQNLPARHTRHSDYGTYRSSIGDEYRVSGPGPPPTMRRAPVGHEATMSHLNGYPNPWRR